VVALGDVPSISRSSIPGIAPKPTKRRVGAVLKETKAGLIRFAAILPESLRQSLSGKGPLPADCGDQGIFGSFDFASDFGAASTPGCAPLQPATPASWKRASRALSFLQSFRQDRSWPFSVNSSIR
jgi:hypothetical protein